MRTWRTDEHGAVTVTVALLLVVFVALSALVVDMGYWYNVRRQCQAAADAAALAGCQELAKEATDGEIWSVVEEYAGLNAVVPVHGLSVIEPTPGGDSDIGEDYVKVTVSTESGSFFGRVFGDDGATIRAQSVAEVGYLAGAKNPMPWALPIVRVTRMVADVEGVGEIALSQDSDGTWSALLPFSSSGDRTVDLIAYNDQTLDPSYPDGVPEYLDDVANLVAIPAASRFADVRMMSNTVTSGYGESVRVYVDIKAPLASGESVVIHSAKDDITLTDIDSTTFSALVTVPDTDDLWASNSFTVAIVKSKKDVETLGMPFYIGCRRSTHPIRDVKVTPVATPAGANGYARITVTLNEYEYGNLYELKVIGGDGENGNFMAIDFHTLRHSPYWRYPQDPAEYPELPSGTNTYYDYIAGIAPYDFIMHIGDTVWTEPGNMSGPQTEAALEDRFGGEPADFDGWVAAGKPGTSRLVYIPITEKIQEANGITPLRVVSFATFYVESFGGENSPSGGSSGSNSGGSLVRGRFVEYIAPSWIVSPEPPGGLVVKTAHLTANHLDF